MKKTYTIEKLIDSSIRVGDIVKLWDGSGLTIVKESSREIYIVDSHPMLTGSNKPLKELDAKVVEIGVVDKVCMGAVDNAYLQDIIIQIGKTLFRTPSNMVRVQAQTVIEQNTDFRGYEKTNCHTMHEAIELVKHFGLKNVKVRAVSGSGEILEEWDNFNKVLTPTKGN